MSLCILCVCLVGCVRASRATGYREKTICIRKGEKEEYIRMKGKRRKKGKDLTNNTQ